jgi:hypothetical protein
LQVNIRNEIITVTNQGPVYCLLRQTSDRIPCASCSEFCCEECVNKTITTSSESCRSGICFVCRNKSLDVVVHNPVNPEITPGQRREHNGLKIFSGYILIFSIVYVCGAFARWFYGENTFVYFLGGAYNESDYIVLSIIYNLISGGCVFLIFLFILSAWNLIK